MKPTPIWTQPALLPPDVVEYTLRVGLVRPSDLLQVQLEAHSPTDGVLLAMESWPGRRITTGRQALAAAIDKLDGWIAFPL